MVDRTAERRRGRGEVFDVVVHPAVDGRVVCAELFLALNCWPCCRVESILIIIIIIIIFIYKTRANGQQLP